MRGLQFSPDLPPGGYAWWYIDAESHDGREALTIIAFVGSVFSPYYHRACTQALPQANPMAHCAINAVLYRPGTAQWAFTERAHPTQTSADALVVGPSHVGWHEGALQVVIQERTAPWGRPLRGTVRLTPSGAPFAPVALHRQRPHWWWPVAPCAEVEVAFSEPAVRWRGRAYHDANWGHEPLARAFTGWSWQRAWHPEGTWITYDPQGPGGGVTGHSAIYRPNGRIEPVAMPHAHALPRSGWGMTRHSRGAAQEIRRLEDTPFYNRSRLNVQLGGASLPTMHEQLDLRRYTAPWVQFLLPFRMRRAANHP